MGKIKDITGQRFGKLMVTRITDKRYNRQIVWECICDCGNICEIPGGSLRSGHTQSCGCTIGGEKNGISEIGKRYGSLIVLERAKNHGANRGIVWKCQCDCGNTREVLGTYLRGGKITGCQECMNKARLQENKTLGPMHNLTGQRFGKLVAIESTTERVNGKIVWKCQCDCGNICFVNSNSLISSNTQSCGCMTNWSKGEEQIEKLLKANNIPYKKQATFSDCIDKGVLRYDFAILNDDNMVLRLIEYDGIQHFKPVDRFCGEQGFQDTQRRDQIKNKYAKENNIPLVRIPYTIKVVTIDMLLGDSYVVKVL